MTDAYETPGSLIEAEKKLNSALDNLQQNLEDVESLSGIGEAFAAASNANKTTVEEFLKTSQAFGKSSAELVDSLDKTAEMIKKDNLATSRKIEQTSQEIPGLIEKLGSEIQKNQKRHSSLFSEVTAKLEIVDTISKLSAGTSAVAVLLLIYLIFGAAK